MAPNAGINHAGREEERSNWAAGRLKVARLQGLIRDRPDLKIYPASVTFSGLQIDFLFLKEDIASHQGNAVIWAPMLMCWRALLKSNNR